jgi:cyanophycinase
MDKNRLIIIAVTLLALIVSLTNVYRKPNVGLLRPAFPAKGYLVLVGGGVISYSIIREFVHLAGGKNANIVVIPTADEDENIVINDSLLKNENPQGNASIMSEKPIEAVTPETFVMFGVKHVTILNTRNRSQADSIDFVKPLRDATGVWFTGGRQWRLADSYLNTRTQAELEDLLKRGGVIGGTSAGASIQGSYLVRGDTFSNLKVQGDHVAGFGFLQRSAIDQHVIARHRERDLIPLIQQKPYLLGIGLDENTAILVHGAQLQVIGSSQVVITDARQKSSRDTATRQQVGIFYLHAGQRFNLLTRSVIY